MESDNFMEIKRDYQPIIATANRYLPAKVAKKIGCAHKRRYSLEIGWSPIFVKILGHEFLVIILGHEFLVNFYVTFPCKTTYIAFRTEKSRVLSG